MILLAHIRGRAIRHIVIAVAVGVALLAVAARGETPPAFGRRCIPADCVAPPSNIPDILSRRALSAGRLAALGATLEFHHGLLTIRQLQLDRLLSTLSESHGGCARRERLEKRRILPVVGPA